ncbi:MAG: hypothetical protein ACLTZY_14460 [Alistipes indistinctus]
MILDKRSTDEFTADVRQKLSVLHGVNIEIGTTDFSPYRRNALGYEGQYCNQAFRPRPE